MSVDVTSVILLGCMSVDKSFMSLGISPFEFSASPENAAVSLVLVSTVEDIIKAEFVWGSVVVWGVSLNVS